MLENLEPDAISTNYVMDDFDTVAMCICLSLLLVFLIVGWIGGYIQNRKETDDE